MRSTLQDLLSKESKIVAERSADDLPCAGCDKFGPVLVIESEGQTVDVCLSCAKQLGIVW